MEDLYTLPDGSTVDISKYSQLEKMNFLLENEGAKKLKGGAKSAIVAPKSKQALPKSTDSKSVNGPSSSQKSNLLNPFEDYDGQEVGDVETWGKPKKQGTKLENLRLPTLEELQKKGEAPPPSESASQEIVDTGRLYDATGNMGKKVNKQDFKLATTEGKKEQKTTGYFTAGEGAVDDLIESIDNPGNKDNQRRDLKYDIDTIKNKIQLTDSELINPYLYYSSKNKKIDDSFVDKNYNSKELESIGVNSDDFDGFLNKKGYKDDFLNKEAEGIYEGTGNATLARYDIGLAKELAKKKMLNMYMEDMQKRDFTRQDLNQDLEITFGVRDKKEIVQNDIFDPTGISKYVEKNFPIVTQKLKDRDVENRKIYDGSKKGGTDFFSWDTVGKMGKSGWNAVVDRTKQISATVYGAIGMEATAEGIRALDEENKFVRPDDRGVSYASGKTASYNGSDYLVDSKGEIYDKDAKIRVTDLFDESEYKNIVETSKRGPSDWMFSPQGAAVQTSGVMADMLIQAAVTRGVGEFGAIASEARVALNGARQTSKFTSLLNDSSQLLRKLPLDRATGYSMIAQGALGYSQGYEDTLKAARDSGINDAEAFKLASTAAQRMAVLYSTTGVINPQTKLAENVFGSRNVIKKAINQYLEVGEKGFVNYIDDIIKSTPRNLVEFAEEGGKEVIQENIQQVGEIGVNRLTNEQAGKKIMNDTMTGDDFMNTSILSFLSSGLISKMKMPSFKAGNEDVDNLSSLSTLAKNRKEFVKIADGLATEKVFTQEQVDKLKGDVDIYNNNVNKIPKSISPEIAMPVMRELDKVTKLQDQKETLDKSFHENIDLEIDGIRSNINSIFNASELERKTKAIQGAINKGVIKNIQMNTFSDSENVFKYLTEELNMPDAEAKDYASKGGFFLDENMLKEYSKDPSLITKGQKVIVVNENYAVETGNTEVAQHEFLHGLIHETIKEDPESQQLLGRSLAKELMKIKDKVDLAGTGETPLPQVFVDRFSLYVKKYQKEIAKTKVDLELGKITQEEHDAEVDSMLGDQWEEALTVYSDAISNGSVKYDEGTFAKLKDVVRQVLQNLGIKDIKFESGRDVYNFLKDYNKSVESGTWGTAMKNLGSQKAEINREKLREETGMYTPKVVQKPTVTPKIKLSLSERKSSEEIKKDVNKNYSKDNFTEKINSQRDPALFNILKEYEFIIKGKAKSLGYANAPDYSELDMIMETQMALMPHIRNFNKEFLQKRNEYKDELISKGFEPNSKELNDRLLEQDEKGYKGTKGIVKENDDLNAWINSQLGNKMKVALNTGNVTSQKFTEDIEGEMFKESKISDGFGGDEGYLTDEGDSIFEAEQDFEQEQNQLAIILGDPVFKFTDEKGNYVDIETIPFGALYVTDVSDKNIPANKKLKTETDPVKIAELKKEINDLKRGLELKSKKDITLEEKQELKDLQSFKSFDLSTGDVISTFKALSIQDTPAKIVIDDVAREILDVPNIETLEFRNFKERLSQMSKTMMKRVTFETGEGLESLMYNNWDLLYDVINHPVDAVTGESTYSSKKLPPTLKEFDDKGNLRKISDITRTKFLQAFYEVEDAVKIIKKYGGKNADKEIAQLEERELNPKTGKPLSQNAHFDRRTALRELFGDVMVLQEARRLIRNEDFLNRVAERNVNLYNSLKDDIIRTKVLNDMAKGKSSRVKFSLAEQANGRISQFLEGLNFKEQWVVARDIDRAVLSGRLSESARNAEVDNIVAKMKTETDEDKLEELKTKLRKTQQGVTTFKVPSRSKMSDKSTAYFIISKVAEGYNNFEFRVKKNADGPLTKQVLDAVDVRNKADKEVYKKNSNLEVAMNDIVEENTGIKSSEKFSAETAKNIGKNVGKNEFYLPPQDEDFLGLIYTLASGKGKTGEAQLQFFKDNLLKPYSDAMLNLMKARQTMYKDWKELIKTKHKGITKLLKQDSGYEGYTLDQAVRVYLWKAAKFDIPGLDSKDMFNLVQLVRTDKRLRDFATDVSLLSKQANGYVEPDKNWGFGSVVGDINSVISKSNRKKYLQQWQSNVDKIFSKDNISKIEAVYGTQYVNALKNMLERMETGTNRQKGSSDEFLNWINGATADVMWWNVRSAALQTLGAINYINTSDNNIVKAGKAFLNVPQFTEDFMTIWRSDYSKDRRSGLMNDVAEAEFAQMMNDPRNKSIGDKLKAANYWLLKNGFNATRYMDSFAIALGGASFYRNRINTYKKQNLSDEDAKAKTMSDFYDVSEQSQQSGDVSKISKNQASTKGRLLLAFLNTPFQYSRLIKRSITDLAKGRGSVENNVAKIVYYAVIQNVMFNVLQNALFSKIWDDDEDDELSTAEIRTINGALDTLLRGAGLTGVLMSVAKNAIVKWYEKSGDPKGYGDVILELANVAPAIGTKLRQVVKAYKAFEYNKDEIIYKGFSLDNTYALEALTSLTTARYNIPLDRVYQKVENVRAALDSEYQTWQRIALAMGYSTWNLGIEETSEEPKTNGRSLKKSILSKGGLKSPGLK